MPEAPASETLRTREGGRHSVLPPALLGCDSVCACACSSSSPPRCLLKRPAPTWPACVTSLPLNRPPRTAGFRSRSAHPPIRRSVPKSGCPRAPPGTASSSWKAAEALSVASTQPAWRRRFAKGTPPRPRIRATPDAAVILRWGIRKRSSTSPTVRFTKLPSAPRR